ncbi:MAG: c-type cytochrome domain-containing protein, partial [Planctomycetaceae bacterium]
MWAAGRVAAEPVDFVHEVVPLLKRHCAECHLGDARQGGFSMNTREALVAGGDSGTAGIVARDAAGSELIARVTSTDPDLRMPSDGPPLPDAAVAVLRRWVDEGAAWEEGFAFSGTAWEPPLQLAEVTLPPPLEGRTNPVDRIVDAYQAARGHSPAPRCDDHTFIRRVSLDLVGLL